MSIDAAAPSQRVPTWKPLLLLAFVFLLGAVAGVAGVTVVVVKRAQHAARSPETAWGPAEMLFKRIESQLATDLDLTAEETQMVHEELAGTLQALMGMRLKFSKDARVLVEATVSRLQARLPPEKRERLHTAAMRRLGPWGLFEQAKDGS